MTADEFLTLVERIENMWPGTKVYANAEHLVDKFQPYGADVGNTAIDRLFREGRQTAPSPSTVFSKMVEVAAGVGVRFEGPHEHRWGNLPPSRLYGGPSSHVAGPGRKICAVCSEEKTCRCEDCQADPRFADLERSRTPDESAAWRAVLEDNTAAPRRRN